MIKDIFAWFFAGFVKSETSSFCMIANCLQKRSCSRIIRDSVDSL